MGNSICDLGRGKQDNLLIPQHGYCSDDYEEFACDSLKIQIHNLCAKMAPTPACNGELLVAAKLMVASYATSASYAKPVVSNETFKIVHYKCA